MKADHIKYLKDIVEGLIVNASGENVFNKKFYEIYPSADSFKRIVPCAALRSFPSVPSKVSSYTSSTSDETTVTKTKQLYEYKFTYQIDFYSRNAYEHIRNLSDENALKPFVNQFAEIVALNDVFYGFDGRDISIDCGPTGSVDEELIVDNIYMSFAKVIITDGIYSSETVSKIKNFNINEGGIS